MLPKMKLSSGGMLSKRTSHSNACAASSKAVQLACSPGGGNGLERAGLYAMGRNENCVAVFLQASQSRFASFPKGPAKLQPVSIAQCRHFQVRTAAVRIVRQAGHCIAGSLQLQELLHQRRVELGACVPAKLLPGLIARHRSTIRPVHGHGIKSRKDVQKPLEDIAANMR